MDDNQGEVDDALEAMGWLVVPTHQLGHGFPDRIAIKAGRICFIEVKDGRKRPSARKLTPDEEAKHAQFKAFGVHVHVIESVSDLASLDRDARQLHEPGIGPREYYPDHQVRG